MAMKLWKDYLHFVDSIQCRVGRIENYAYD